MVFPDSSENCLYPPMRGRDLSGEIAEAVDPHEGSATFGCEFGDREAGGIDGAEGFRSRGEHVVQCGLRADVVGIVSALPGERAGSPYLEGPRGFRQR